MDTETQRKSDDYVALYGAISEKTDNDAVAIAFPANVTKHGASTLLDEELARLGE